MEKQTACYIRGYPRPQMVRNLWYSLNGEWEFRFDDDRQGERNRWYEKFGGENKIQVPFSYETKLSGIGKEEEHFCVWYARNLELDRQNLAGKRVILHFEGCDYLTRVWINGKKAGEHEGGYTRFSFDITDYLEKINRVVVRAEDTFDEQQLRGKQRWRKESFRCWYVQTTGIWKNVWMEIVDEIYISSLKLIPKAKERALGIELDIIEERICNNITVRAQVSFGNKLINTIEFPAGSNHTSAVMDVSEIDEDAELNGIHYWSPEKPDLYDVKISLYSEGRLCDEVGSYFGMREITAYQGNILLNEEPVFQRLILDQGYWKESGMTPPSEEAIIEDIKKTKELGFNGARKHQKIEDERYYYWCDVLGLLTWCEIPSAYRFGDREVSNYMREASEIVKQYYNHPSIIVWTAFNESWGINEIRTDIGQQHLTEAVYHMIKSVDSSRLVVANDGWEHTVSDIISLHDYEEDAEMFLERYKGNLEEILEGKIYHNLLKPVFADHYHYAGQPVIISEYGGIAFCNEQKGWGYGNKVKTTEEFIDRYETITSAIKKIPYLCGYCYTQLTDVYQEINGLMDEKRNFKIDAAIIRSINQKRLGIKMKGSEVTQ